MRTFTSKFAWMMVVLMPFLFGSCDSDPDYDTAYTLEGTWEGKMFLSSTWDNYTYAISYTQLCFNRDPYYYASGTGYWVDYYSDAPWDYVANHIEWQVRGGRIEVYLVEDNYTYFIEDYRLSDNIFRGRIYDNDTYLDFSMRHTITTTSTTTGIRTPPASTAMRICAAARRWWVPRTATWLPQP